MLKNARDIVAVIASGTGPIVAASDGSCTNAAKLALGSCSIEPLPGDDASNWPPGHPGFTQVADDLRVLVEFLRHTLMDAALHGNLASVPEGQSTIRAVRGLCSAVGRPLPRDLSLPLRSSLPAGADCPSRFRLDGGVSVSLLHLAAEEGPYKKAAQDAVMDTITHTDRLHNLLQRESSDPIIAAHLDQLTAGSVSGKRRYIPLHGKHFNDIPEGETRQVMHDLARICLVAAALLLKAAGFPDSVKPNQNSLAILIGDSQLQLAHFDVMKLLQLIMLLTPGYCPLVQVAPVDSTIDSESSDALRRRISSLSDESTPDLLTINGRSVSRVEASAYMSSAARLLRNAGDATQYDHVRKGLCAPGTGNIFQSAELHCGPGPVPGFSDGTASAESCREQEASLYRDKLPAAAVLVSNPSRMTSPRMSLFCTLSTPEDEKWRNPDGSVGLSMFHYENTGATQNREDVTRDILGLHKGLPLCYIRLFGEGYGKELVGFLDAGSDKRIVVAALYHAWSNGEIEYIRLISAAFPAAFSGQDPRTRDAHDGLELARRLAQRE